MKNLLYGIIAMTLLSACSKAPESTELTFDLSAGKAIAETDCSECHGLDGRGTKSEIPNLTGQSAEYLIETLHAYRDGGRMHPALQDLTASMSEADITNIAGYYASQPALKAATKDFRDSNVKTAYAEGEKVAAICEDCHGDKGISMEAGVPSLAGQQPGYLIAATRDYKSGIRGHEAKVKMLDELELVDIEKMAMYFAAQVAPAREPPPFGDPVAGKAASADCEECHGSNGISQDPLVPSLAGQEPEYLRNAIEAYKNHQRNSDDQASMKTADQVDNLAAYYAIQHADTSMTNEHAAKVLIAKCDRCHSPASKERKLSVPSLNGQSYDYLVKAMHEYRNQDRDNSMMHKMSSRYSDEMIEKLATYYAGKTD